MLNELAGRHGFFAVVIVFLVVLYVAPTVIALVRGIESAALFEVILFNVIPLGWPAALLMAVFIPGRERVRAVELPRVPGYPPDQRYSVGDARARYPRA
jgi:hypothetical protein